jgi:uncharacterized delta-60 repeat protein
MKPHNCILFSWPIGLFEKVIKAGPCSKAIRTMIPKFVSSLATALGSLLFLATPLHAAVAISTQPQSTNVLAGDVAVFTVSATGTGTLSYQWKKDGNAIAGATNSGLVLNPARSTNVGSYTVDVSDAAPSTLTSSVATLTLRSPVPGDVDFSFAGGASINGAILAMAMQSDGKVLIGGDFATINSMACSGIARLNPDGSTDYSFGNHPTGFNSGVYAVALQSDGKVLIGGSFTTFIGAARNGIARLNSDGTLDTSFGNGLAGVDNLVYAIVAQSDGKVLIVGGFRTVNGTARGGIARLNSDGTLDTSFGNGLAGANDYVYAVALQSDGKLLIGGDFTTLNGTTINHIARLNSDGTLDTSFGNSLTGADQFVSTLALQSDGKVLIGGGFTNVNGTTINRIARLNSDGTLDTSFGNGLAGVDPYVHTLVLQGDGKVLIGGHFTNVNGTAHGRFARLNSDGTLDTFFGNGLTGADNALIAVALQSDGKALIGGYFTTVNGTAHGRIARLNSDGTLDTSFDNGLAGVNGAVNALAVQNNEKVLIGGSFTAVNGTARGHIARLNSNGTLDTSFGNGLGGVNNTVSAVAIQSDGKMVIGGDFTNVNSTARGRIARLNSDGTLDTSFGNGLAGANSYVYALALQSDGKVLIGGGFSTVNGTTRGRIARLNSDGTLDTSFGNGLTGVGGVVYAIAVRSDGKVVIAGDFTTVNSTVRGGVARLNSDGTLDTSFGNGLAGANSYVYALALQSNGQVLIGGGFTTVNGTPRGRIARLNSDGTLDTSFGNGLAGASGSVYAATVQSDGKVLIGGSFTAVNGTARGHIARLNSDGTLDTSFGNGLAGVNSLVSAVAVQNNGKVLIGGSFAIVNGTVRSSIARLWSSPAPTNATLSALAVSSGTLAPTFAANTLSYTATVSNAVTSITIIPTTADTNATVTVNGATAATPVPLSVGTNLISLLVTAQDGVTTTTYTVMVTRAAPSLNITTRSNTVTLYWRNEPGWNLQETTSSPTASTDWTYSPGVALISGTNYLKLTNTIGNRFYRLSFP